MKIVAVRIKGRVNVPKDIKRTLQQLRLPKKFSCWVYDDKPELLGMLKKAERWLSYGPLEPETLKLLLEKRGKGKIKTEEIEKFVHGFFENKHSMNELQLKNFSLHPPRGGFKKSTRLLSPRGVLGWNEKINQLIQRML